MRYAYRPGSAMSGYVGLPFLLGLPTKTYSLRAIAVTPRDRREAFTESEKLDDSNAVPKHDSRIVGGEDTTIEEYPFMASIKHGYLGIVFRQVCGGTLITGTAVLSAAHCYRRDSPSEWRVRLGSTYASSGGSEHLVSRFILHENYNELLLLNDIAMVRLATAAVISNSINPARIAGTNYHLPDGTGVYAAGWGRLSPGGLTSETLQHVGTFLINHDLCTTRYANLKTQPGFQNWPDVTPDMLCAGILDVGGKNPCQYDVGGPLVHQGDIVVGVISWGFGCGDSVYPGVNVRVSSYTNWITTNAIA